MHTIIYILEGVFCDMLHVWWTEMQITLAIVWIHGSLDYTFGELGSSRA